MNYDAQITALFKDAATRHPDILHADTLDVPRFYEMEWDAMMQNGQQLEAFHWTMILEEYTEKFHDNGGDHTTMRPHISFMIGKHVPSGERELLKQVYAQARTIAHNIIGKFAEDALDDCNADVPVGVKAPEIVDLSTLSIQKIKLPMLDEAFGVRASIRMFFGTEEHFSRDEVEWAPLT